MMGVSVTGAEAGAAAGAVTAGGADMASTAGCGAAAAIIAMMPMLGWGANAAAGLLEKSSLLVNPMPLGLRPRPETSGKDCWHG